MERKIETENKTKEELVAIIKLQEELISHLKSALKVSERMENSKFI